MMRTLKPFAMRNLTLCLILFPLLAFAQKKEIFRIDSLPKEGILLNQGWKWHAGDNLEWAKPEFDDSKWIFLPPLDLMDSLPQKLRPSGIRWFRLKLEFGKSLSKAILALAIDQVGASEIYMNGKLLKRYGVVSSNPDEVKAFNPLLDPIPFAVSKDSMVVLAVRYTYQNNIHKYLPSPPNLIGLTITVNNLEIIQSSKMLYLTRHYDSNTFRVGAFFILFISYFALYFYNPVHKANLFLCLFSLTILIADLIQLKYYNYHWIAESTFFITLFFFLLAVGKILLLTAVCFLMNQKINWLFGLLSGLILLSYFLFIVIGYHPVLIFLIVHIFPNLINLEIIRITLKAIQSQKKGAWIIALGGIVFLISVVVFVLSIYFNFIDTPLWGSVETIGDLVYNVSWLSIPLAVAIYFGQEVALNNRFLKEKLTEVEQLSAEKQRILSTQNETLEHQVTEQTAELSQKNTELELEASLERVRSKALAMQQSKEVLDVAAVLYDELQKLDFTFGTIGINLIEDKTNEMESWVAGFGHENYPQSYRIPYFEHPLQKSMIEAWRNGASYLVYQLQGEEKRDYDDFMFTQSDYKVIPEEVKQRMITTESATFSLAYMKHRALLWAPTPLSEKKALILQRFAAVFEQVYTRFLDLQKAEAQAREAQIEVGLERVRSRISAMQKSSDLADCTQLLFQRIQDLKLPLFTCGFCFIEESLGIQRGGTVSPDGTLIPDLIDFPLTGDEVLDQRYESWKQKKPLHIAVLEGEANKEHHRFLASKVPTVFSDEIIKHIPDKIIFYSANFLQGYIIILTTVYLKKEEEQILQRFATVFEQTYTRFLDLKKAEAQAEQARLNLIQIQTEKKRAEEALIALKQTQAQLIQSEKLASLGELTAGIAHEIQNPLNFVNNFAEVSAEMLDDMEEELDKGDTSEAKALAADLKNNLKKINHHGQRASSIVKGMLEHSRASTGVKELTDINALADEFLRLAYHGLRAKDNSFNATMETHFDPELPEIEVIPQDIGRVLLNLINNAFYAVSEKAKQGIEGYSPTVTLGTKKLEEAIEITVKDNGNGIPDAIKDKIFQPFFTTKPTGQGTGLGLSLAYDIVVKGHGGTLEVSSVPNEGTEFVIRLV
jgi:signal transduction histidine kinase